MHNSSYFTEIMKEMADELQELKNRFKLIREEDASIARDFDGLLAFVGVLMTLFFCLNVCIYLMLSSRIMKWDTFHILVAATACMELLGWCVTFFVAQKKISTLKIKVNFLTEEKKLLESGIRSLFAKADLYLPNNDKGKTISAFDIETIIKVLAEKLKTELIMLRNHVKEEMGSAMPSKYYRDFIKLVTFATVATSIVLALSS